MSDSRKYPCEVELNCEELNQLRSFVIYHVNNLDVEKQCLDLIDKVRKDSHDLWKYGMEMRKKLIALENQIEQQNIAHTELIKKLG